MDDFCDQCECFTTVTPFCDHCHWPLATASMQLGENENARRTRARMPLPRNHAAAVGEGRELFRRLYRSPKAVDYLAGVYAVGIGYATMPRARAV